MVFSVLILTVSKSILETSLDSDFKDTLKSIIVASMGICSVLLISLGLSYSSEIANPIKTAIPHFTMILGSILVLLVEYKRKCVY